MSMITRRGVLQVAAAAAPILIGGAEALAAIPPVSRRRVTPVVPELVPQNFHSLPFEAQALEGLLQDRMRVNANGRLLQIDEATILSSFTKRDDNGGWIGEHAGKFLDAACNALRYQKNEPLQRIVERVARTLMASQDADGYLGTYQPEYRWTGWDVWGQKYTLIGLLSYYEFSADPAALTACRKIGDLLGQTFGFRPGQRDIIASGVHIGMAATSVLEPMCALYRMTGKPRYLEFCKYIVRAYDQPHGPRIVTSLLEHGSVCRTANGKAYEMLSNFNGLVDLYRLTGDSKLLSTVLRAWDDIVRTQLYCTGSMSAKEHFQTPGELLAHQSSNIGEMCVTVTWLQLNWRLMRLTGEARFGQEIERTVYNQLLAAQDPRSGKIAYYTAPNGYKEFTDYSLCCVSSGPRGISLLPLLAWGLGKGLFVINLYTSGRAHFEIDGVSVEAVSQSQFPSVGEVELRLSPEQPVHFTLRLRVPEWARQFQAKLDDKVFLGQPGQMLDIENTWRPNSTVAIRMDLPTRTLPCGPNYPDFVALQRGPQVLALEKSVNTNIPFLTRVGLRGSTGLLNTNFIRVPDEPKAPDQYEVRGIALVNPIHREMADCSLRFVPFANAVNYRIWLSANGVARNDVPPVTAYARATTSEMNLLLEPVDQQQKTFDISEYLTDENSKSFCTVDPRRHISFVGMNMVPGKKGETVWFSVVLESPAAISRVVFRQGIINESGGWFDTSVSKPVIEVVRARPISFEKGAFVAFLDSKNVRWEQLAVLDAYPHATSSVPPKLQDGQSFEMLLRQPEVIYAIRIAGKCGRDFASCSELSAYA